MISNSNKIIHIESDSQQVKIDFRYTNRHGYGGWVSINPNCFIRPAGSDLQYTMLEAKDIPIAPKSITFRTDGDILYYTLTFPAVPEDIHEIDIIEEENDETSFNYYNIPLKISKMKTSIKPKHCCRYTWSLFPKLSIKKVLELNPWLFDQSFNFFAYYDDKNIIPEGVFELEKNWITENFVLFSGVCNNIKDYIDRVDWDNFGTWYVYLYPSEIKAEKPIIIGRETLLDKGKGDNLADYFDMSKEWEFIHKVQPDLFITKQKNGVMIGALNDLNLWCVDSKKNSK